MQRTQTVSKHISEWWRRLLPFEGLSGKRFARTVEHGKEVVRYIYYLLAFFSIWVAMQIDGLISNSSGEGFTPQWPIAWWAETVSFHTAGLIVQGVFVGTAFLAALYYRRVAVRVLTFLVFTQVHAFFNSIAGNSHEYYHILYVLFAFAFLPNIWTQSATKERCLHFLAWLWGAQAFVLLSYTMAGFAKVDIVIEQLTNGSVSILSPSGLALMLAYWGDQFQQIGILGDTIIHNPWFGWPVYITTQLYLLLFSFVVAFRPSLHRLWALLLIAFHISTFLAIHIIFWQSIGILIFLFFNSPFRPQHVTWRRMFSDLPVFGDAWRLLKVINKTIQNKKS